MTLYMRDLEKIEEGRAKERIDAIQNLLRKGVSEEFILSLSYSKEEYLKAQELLLSKV